MQIALRAPVIIITDDDLVRASEDNPGYQFERESDGTILVSPTHTRGGAKSAEALFQLCLYAKKVGGRAFDSSTGFAIGPDLRVYSPDASWVSQPRIDRLNESESAGFWPISPDVVVEIKSDSDRFKITVDKVKIFMAQGSHYAVAIDPTTREVAPHGSPPDGLQLDFDAIIDA